MRHRTTVFSFVIVALTATASAQTLRVYHIDVDQGAATLFVAPSGRSLLIDSGKNSHGKRIKATMDEAGVSEISYFVATHYHEDHYGGIDDLVNDFQVTVEHSYDRGDKSFLPATKRQEATFRDYQEAVGSAATHIKPGDTIPLDPSMTVTCVASGGRAIGQSELSTAEDENDMSVALLVTFGNFREFVGGDIHEHTESLIADRDAVLDVDIYEANHHGSHTSSSQAFMDDLAPTVVIISNGNTAAYQHPRKVTLDRYADLSPPPTVFQTNKYLAGGNKAGNVSNTFIADLESTDDDGTILVTVDAGDGSYTVSYGTGASHEFSTKNRSDLPGAPSVVIKSLLPDPPGDDRQLEKVTLKNASDAAVDLTGWTLRNSAERSWSLSSLGTLGAGQSKTIRRNGMAMWLANSGDSITLLDPGQSVIDHFEYTGSQQGVVVETGH